MVLEMMYFVELLCLYLGSLLSDGSKHLVVYGSLTGERMHASYPGIQTRMDCKTNIEVAT